MNKAIISIGYDKDGDEDFSISAEILSLTREQMDRLRAMSMVAIGVAEDMWRRGMTKANPADENKNYIK